MDIPNKYLTVTPNDLVYPKFFEWLELRHGDDKADQLFTSITSYVWILKSLLHWDHAMVSYAHYILPRAVHDYKYIQIQFNNYGIIMIKIWLQCIHSLAKYI